MPMFFFLVWIALLGWLQPAQALEVIGARSSCFSSASVVYINKIDSGGRNLEGRVPTSRVQEKR